MTWEILFSWLESIKMPIRENIQVCLITSTHFSKYRSQQKWSWIKQNMFKRITAQFSETKYDLKSVHVLLCIFFGCHRNENVLNYGVGLFWDAVVANHFHIYRKLMFTHAILIQNAVWMTELHTMTKQGCWFFCLFFCFTQPGHVIRAYRLCAIISNTWTAMLILHTTDSTDNLVI